MSNEEILNLLKENGRLNSENLRLADEIATLEAQKRVLEWVIETMVKMLLQKISDE